MREKCINCGKNGRRTKGRKKDHSQIYDTLCSGCHIRKFYGCISAKNYKNKKEKIICEFCQFVPVNPCQIDIDHKDGNPKNNKIENLQALCANCHRLKTYINKDWEK